MQVQQSELIQQLQEHIAQLERENGVLRAEVTDLRQRVSRSPSQASIDQPRVVVATPSEALQAEILLRKQTEVALCDSERRFRYTFEQAAVGMTLSDLNTRWLRINQRFCDMVGYSESELLALTFLDITHPDNIASDRAMRQQLIDNEMPFYQTEKRYICKDSSLLWAELTISVVRDATGDPAYFIAVIQDISQRKEAQLVAQGQQTALQRTLAVLATEPELDRFLGQVLATIGEQLHAPVVDIWLSDVEQDVSSLHLTHWNTQLVPTPAPFRPISVPLSVFHESAAWDSLVNRHQPFVYSDLPNHPDFALLRAWSTIHDGVQTMLVIPLVSGDDLLGTFVISHLQNHPYPSEALQLITALAQQVVLALQLTRLAEDAKQVAIVEEHNRLAREIHDTLAQTFTGISLQLNNAQYYATQDAAIAWEIVEQVKILARTGLAEARRSVWSLHPDADEYRDLAGSLARSLTQLTLHTSLQTDLAIIGTPQLVPPDIGMNLLRIGQEAVTNTLRHAQAQALQIELTFAPDAIALQIQDDGRGFDLQLQHDRGGFGLLGIQQRCDRLGGELTLRSQLGQGTSILIQTPLTLP